MTEDENVTKLPVRFKGANEKRFLVVKRGDCLHDGAVLVDEKLSEVECAKCGEKLNPMAVLHDMASRETQWHQIHDRYKDEMKRLDERKRTKCERCGHMTRISRR